MNEFLSMYKRLNEEQKDKIFSKEQQLIINKQIALLKILDNPCYAKKVCEVMGEEIYFKLREEN